MRRIGRELTPGRESRPLASAVGALGVLLCSEVGSANAARERVRLGAQVLVNPASDRWYPIASAAEQHLQMAVFRAVETRRPLLRVSSGSSSAVIDRRGRVQTVLPDASAVLTFEPADETSPYQLASEALPIGAIALLVLTRKPRARGETG